MNGRTDFVDPIEKLKSELAGIPPLFLSEQSNMLIINEDKLFKIVTLNQEKLRSRLLWLTPLGLLITSVASLIGVDAYKTSQHIVPGAFQAFFALVAICSGFWLVSLWKTIVDCARHPDKGIGDQVDSIIKVIKAGSTELETARRSPSLLDLAIRNFLPSPPSE